MKCFVMRSLHKYQNEYRNQRWHVEALKANQILLHVHALIEGESRASNVSDLSVCCFTILSAGFDQRGDTTATLNSERENMSFSWLCGLAGVYESPECGPLLAFIRPWGHYSFH